jgi:hypothetical protein
MIQGLSKQILFVLLFILPIFSLSDHTQHITADALPTKYKLIYISKFNVTLTDVSLLDYLIIWNRENV